MIYIEKSIFPNLDVIIYIEYFKKQDSDVILTGKKIDKDKFTSEISLLSFSVVMSYLGLFNFFQPRCKSEKWKSSVYQMHYTQTQYERSQTWTKKLTTHA